MITFLIILGVILGLIGLALISYVKVYFYFETDQKTMVKLKIMGIPINFNKKKKQKKQNRKKAKKQEEEYEEVSLIKAVGFRRLIAFIFSEELGLFGKIKYLFNKMVFKKLKLTVVSASDDAAKTALMHGSISAILYPFIGVLESVTTIKSEDVKIYCDFEAESPHLMIDTCVKIRIFYLLKLAFKLIIPIKQFAEEISDE